MFEFIKKKIIKNIRVYREEFRSIEKMYCFMKFSIFKVENIRVYKEEGFEFIKKNNYKNLFEFIKKSLDLWRIRRAL